MPDAAQAAIRAALQQTTQAGSARIVYALETDWTIPRPPESNDRGVRQFVARGVLAVGKVLGPALFRLMTRGMDFRRQTGNGVLDISQRRSMIDYGGYAQLQVAEKEWRGRSGQLLDESFEDHARVGSPLWLLDLLAGVSVAEEQGPLGPGPHIARYFRVTIDLAQASAVAPFGMASPSRDHFEELHRLEAEVWLDDSHIQQIQFTDGRQTYILTLSDFGADVDNLDWTRLPTVEPPEGGRPSDGL
ncbi:hypothetical protein [Microlunatus sp. GCM10028923]|uniref:hypothetical protein n=1 Tax=Microlunatus sp. GCM10028923 TaxID=3273400 RepID=UPI003613E969